MILKYLIYVALIVTSPFKKIYSIFHRIASSSRVETRLCDLGGSYTLMDTLCLLVVRKGELGAEDKGAKANISIQDSCRQVMV